MMLRRWMTRGLNFSREVLLDDVTSSPMRDDEEVGPWVAFDAGRIVDILLLVYSFLCTKRMP